MNKGFILFALTFALALVFFDSSIFPIAMPSVEKELKIDSSSFILNIYFIANAVALIPGGKLGDLFGCKKMLVGGLLLFGLASLGPALAPSSHYLMIARTMQGIASGITIPCAFALMVSSFSNANLGKALGLSVIIASLFLLLGLLLGGLITEHFSWRFLFVIEGVIAIIGFFSCLIFLSEMPSGKNQNLFDLAFVKNKTFIVGNLAILSAQFLSITPHFLGKYFQLVLKFSPSKASFFILISGLPMFIIPIISGSLTDRYGPKKPIVVGFLLSMFSYLGFYLFTKVEKIYFLSFSCLLFGIGTSFMVTPIGIVTMKAVSNCQRGFAASIYNIIRLMGSSLAICVLSTISLKVYTAEHSSLFKEAFFSFPRISISYLAEGNKTKDEFIKGPKEISLSACSQRSDFDWMNCEREKEKKIDQESIQHFQNDLIISFSVAFFGLILTLTYLEGYKEKKVRR